MLALMSLQFYYWSNDFGILQNAEFNSIWMGVQRRVLDSLNVRRNTKRTHKKDYSALALFYYVS